MISVTDIPAGAPISEGEPGSALDGVLELPLLRRLLAGPAALAGSEARALDCAGHTLVAVKATEAAEEPPSASPAASLWAAAARAAAASRRPLCLALESDSTDGPLADPSGVADPCLFALPVLTGTEAPVVVLCLHCRAQPDQSPASASDGGGADPRDLLARDQVAALGSLLADTCRARQAEAAARDAAFVLEQAQRVGNIGCYDFNILRDHWTSSDTLNEIFGIGPGYDRTVAGWLGLVHPEDRARMQAYVVERVVGKGEPFDQIYRILHRIDGRVRWLHGRGKVFRDDRGRVTRLLGTIQDITDRKEAEEQTRQMLDTLTRTNNELERFAYVASHDLQEPIRSMVAYAQLLQRRYAGILDEDADAFLDFIAQGAKRMQALVHDILEYARIPMRSEEYAPVDLNGVLDSVLRSLAAERRETDARLHLEPLPTVLGDRLQLVSLFQHLLGNAMKFRKANTAPEIRVATYRAGADHVVTVSDNGIGIDPAHQGQVFEVFRRLHTIQTYPGTGIGLAIAKRIVERHRGRIWVESASGMGATFFLRLPGA